MKLTLALFLLCSAVLLHAQDNACTVLHCPDEIGQGGSPVMLDRSGKNFANAFTDVQHGVTFTAFHSNEPVHVMDGQGS